MNPYANIGKVQFGAALSPMPGLNSVATPVSAQHPVLRISSYRGGPQQGTSVFLRAVDTRIGSILSLVKWLQLTQLL